jgi:hypothetical protein
MNEFVNFKIDREQLALRGQSANVRHAILNRRDAYVSSSIEVQLDRVCDRPSEMSFEAEETFATPRGDRVSPLGDHGRRGRIIANLLKDRRSDLYGAVHQ